MRPQTLAVPSRDDSIHADSRDVPLPVPKRSQGAEEMFVRRAADACP